MSTHFLKRVWTPSDSCNSWKQWVSGNEIWELKNDILEHFCITKRILEGKELHEILRPLPETPVPYEAIFLPATGLGWTITVIPEVQEKATKINHDQLSVVSDTSFSSYTSQPRWTSLSHWIPLHALNQPSLHHQALLELSDKSIHIVISKKRKSAPLHAKVK